MKFQPFREWSILSKISNLTVLSFVLFAAGTTVVVPRFFEKQIVSERKKLVQNRSALAERMLDQFVKLADEGVLSPEQAKAQAMQALRGIRYAPEDYFWVAGVDTRLLMHPLFPEGEGKLFSEITALKGNTFLERLVELAKTQSEGILEYDWPKDRGGKPTRKIGFVKLYRPWNWVVGTGIYLDDIHREVFALSKGLIGGTLGFVIFIILMDYLLAAWIVSPLKKVLVTIDAIASGQRSVQVESYSNTDEVGKLLSAVKRMADNIARADADLRLSREQYQALFTRMFDGFVLSEVMEGKSGENPNDWNVLEVNPAFERLVGRTRDCILARSWNEFLPDFASEYLTILSGVALWGDNLRFETHLSEVDKYVGVVAFCPKPRQCAVVFTDISQRKRDEKEKERFQEQLLHASKLASIGTLAAGIAHEINNPLTIVDGNITLLRDRILQKKVGDERIEDLLLKQEAGLRRIANIVNGLRMFVRTDTPGITTIDLNQVVVDTVLLVEEIYRKLDVRVVLSLKEGPAFVKGNAGKLQQVVMNLVSNAKDAVLNLKGERRIEIETFREDESYVLKVTDNGKGIDPRNFKKIFDPFFTTKPPGTGTGLGLSLSQTIVASMGGRIEVDSVLARGSVFKVIIPRVGGEELVTEKREEGMPAQVSLPEERLHGRALLVDDEIGVREILRRYLESFGLETEEAGNGVDALAKILQSKEREFDFVVTDLKMPKMGGDVLIKESRVCGTRKTKYLLITGGLTSDYLPSDYSGTDADVQEIFGADGYLRKPFKRAELLEALIQVREGKSKPRESKV